IAQSGDFGYTTGPYELRKEKTDKKPFRTGSYVSVWKRQKGQWKVALDTGIAYPPTGTPPKVSFTTGKPGLTAKTNGKVKIANERSNLLELDRAFAKEAAQQGTQTAFLKYLSSDARLLRSERYPMTTTHSIRTFLKEQKGVLSWRAIEADISSAGDLGYTYGLAEYLPANADGQLTEYSHYLRIWKKQANGQWRVVLDLATPAPAPASKP
ncbi:MAG TPA: nuclear transport factor 2 family protein, partial [Blastocatellia bacterium]|nr:nuclear transport factor 2 family protein [Blastocatellia bacterium]